MIGRSYRFAHAVGGADGVKQCVCLLREEFEAAKALVGRRSIAEIDRSVIW
jgi:isopentenyl diphosphate isomerase/L-lactate dehydrogenase-like FMN-dependent dehydrogenase